MFCVVTSNLKFVCQKIVPMLKKSLYVAGRNDHGMLYSNIYSIEICVLVNENESTSN